MRLALSRPFGPSSRDLWSRLHAILLIARSRRDLRNLDAHMLQDIGLTRSQAMTEAERPVWDAPGNWRQ